MPLSWSIADLIPLRLSSLEVEARRWLWPGGCLWGVDAYHRRAGVGKSMVALENNLSVSNFSNTDRPGTWVWALSGAPSAAIEDLSAPHLEKVEKLKS